MHVPRFQTVRRFRFNRPQQYAALLLFSLLVQCLWVVQHQTLTERDYQYARCGREMWERPSPLAGYFTSCGNLHDGTLAYRAAGLPLTIQRILAGQGADVSTWEMRHELSYVRLLMRLPFVLCGLALGACVWWVTRRLYGNAGGYVALALYCFSPEIVRACTYPNNEILAAFGLYAAVYTAIGVSHAMQGPPRKWRARIILLTLALGVTAAAHVSAAMVGFVVSIAFMTYLAEGRRAYIPTLSLVWIMGTLLVLFASYAFRPDAFSYVFRSSAGRMWFGLDGARSFFTALPNAGVTLAAAGALALYAVLRRSRYFGNTTPLLVSLLLLPLLTTGIPSQPWLWAVPFLLSFVGGVFADALEGSQGKLFFWVTAALLTLQAALSVTALPALAQ